MFDIATVLFAAKSAIPSAGEAMGFSLFLGIMALAGGIIMHVLAKKSKTGLKLSHVWGVRTRYTMVDDETFAYANKQAWKYVYFVGIISYLEAIVLFLVFFMVAIMDESILQVAGNTMIISVIIWAVLSIGAAIYSSKIANKAAKVFTSEKEKTKTLAVKAEEK